MVSTRVSPNATQQPVEIVGASTFGRYPKISNARTFNMFITTAEPENAWLVSFAGYQKIVDVLPSGQGRALFNSTRGDFAITVVSNMVYRIDNNFNLSTIGMLTTSTGEVFIAENLNQQIVLVDGVNAYIYYYGTPTGPITLLTLDPRLTPNYVEYHNTYFLFGNATAGNSNGSLWFVYGVDGSSNLVLDLVTSLAIQTKADYALAVKRMPGRGNNVIVMGDIVSEVWTQIPGLQVYERNESINIDYGCVSVATIGNGYNYLVWLAQNEQEQPVIMTYDGNDVTRISTDGIDYLLSTMQFPMQSTAILYRIDGHLFYQLTFFNPADNLTLLYDFNTKLFFNLSDQYLNFHPARQIIFFNTNQYFCSLDNGSIYKLDSDITVINENILGTTNPDPDLIFDMQRIRITPSIRNDDSSRFIANSLVLTLEQGMDQNYLGPPLADYLITENFFNPSNDDIITENDILMVDEDSPNSQTNNLTQTYYQPRIDLAISKDGANTWSNYVARGLHPIGHRRNILHWEAMGVANDLCFKFRFWGSYRFVVNQALLDIIL